MTKIIETNIESLVPDNKNFNKGTEYGDRLIVECGDVTKLSLLFSELQDRGFTVELKE